MSERFPFEHGSLASCNYYEAEISSNGTHGKIRRKENFLFRFQDLP